MRVKNYCIFTRYHHVEFHHIKRSNVCSKTLIAGCIILLTRSRPSGKLPFECQKYAKNTCHFFSKQKPDFFSKGYSAKLLLHMSIFSKKKLALEIFWKNGQYLDFFLHSNGYFSEGQIRRQDVLFCDCSRSHKKLFGIVKSNFLYVDYVKMCSVLKYVEGIITMFFIGLRLDSAINIRERLYFPSYFKLSNQWWPTNSNKHVYIGLIQSSS